MPKRIINLAPDAVLDANSGGTGFDADDIPAGMILVSTGIPGQPFTPIPVPTPPPPAPSSVALFYAATIDAFVVNTISETSIKPGTFNGVDTIPANSLAIGDVFRLRVQGIYNTFSVSPGTLIFRVRFNGALAQQSLTMNLTSGLTASPWFIDQYWNVRSIGAGGTLQLQGLFAFGTSDSGPPMSIFRFGNTGALAALDTTINQQFDLTLQYSSGNTVTRFTTNNFTIEKLRV